MTPYSLTNLKPVAKSTHRIATLRNGSPLRLVRGYRVRWHLRCPLKPRIARASACKTTLASQLSQSDRNTLLRQRALVLVQQGQYNEAIALFTQLLKQNPHSASDYNNRGLVYFQAGQMDQAIADYNRALEINPCLDSVYNNRANYYAAQGKLVEAILDYDNAIEINPNNVRAWINQGITFRDLKMYEDAIECFELALCFTQFEGHIYAERGRTYHLWGDWNYAVADYQRALEHLPLETSVSMKVSVRLRSQVEGWLNDLLQVF